MKRLVIIFGIVCFTCSLSANDSRPVTNANTEYSSETLELLISQFSPTGDAGLPAEKISHIFDGQKINQPVFMPAAAYSADLPPTIDINTDKNGTNSTRFIPRPVMPCLSRRGAKSANTDVVELILVNRVSLSATFQQNYVKDFSEWGYGWGWNWAIWKEAKKKAYVPSEQDIEKINEAFSLLKQTRTGKKFCREVFGLFDSCNYNSLKKIKTQIKLTNKEIYKDKGIAAFIDNANPKTRTIYIDKSFFKDDRGFPIVLAHEIRHAGDIGKYKLRSKEHKVVQLAMEQRAHLTEVRLYKELSEKGKLPAPIDQKTYLSQVRFLSAIWDYKNKIGPEPIIADYTQLDAAKLSRILKHVSQHVNNGGVAVTEAVRLEIYPQYDVPVYPAYSDYKLLASRMFSDAIKRDVKFRKWWKKSHPPAHADGANPDDDNYGNDHNGNDGWTPPPGNLPSDNPNWDGR